MPPSCESETCQCRTPRAAARAATVPRDDEMRTPGIVSHDLRVRPAHATGCAQRLGERLLRGEPRGQRLGRPGTAGVGNALFRGEQPVGQGRRAARAHRRTAPPEPRRSRRRRSRGRRRCGARRRVVRQVSRERRHRWVEVCRRVVDRGGNLAETGGDQPNLALVVDDVAGRVNAGDRRRALGCRPRYAGGRRSRCPIPAAARDSR